MRASFLTLATVQGFRLSSRLAVRRLQQRLPVLSVPFPPRRTSHHGPAFSSGLRVRGRPLPSLSSSPGRGQQGDPPGSECAPARRISLTRSFWGDPGQPGDGPLCDHRILAERNRGALGPGRHERDPRHGGPHRHRSRLPGARRPRHRHGRGSPRGAGPGHAGPWPSPAGGSPAGSAPYFVYPPPLFGRVDDPFFGFEPPLVSFPPWATSGGRQIRGGFGSGPGPVLPGPDARSRAPGSPAKPRLASRHRSRGISS